MKKSYFLLILIISISCGPANKQKRIMRTFDQANKKLEQGYYDEAVSLYSEVIAQDSKITDAFMNRGVAYYESGHYALALGDYNYVYFNHPEYSQVLFNRIYCHMAMNRLPVAKEDMQQLKSLYQDSSLVYVIEGLLLIKESKPKDAIEAFSTAIQKDPKNYDAWTNKGIVEYQQKDYVAAERDLLTALKIHENSMEALNPLSLVYAEQQKLELADSTIDRALLVYPDQPYLLNNKGMIKIYKNDLVKADSLIRRSLSLDSMNSWAFKNLGLLEMKNGNKTAAKAALQKAIELDSVITITSELLNQLGL